MPSYSGKEIDPQEFHVPASDGKGHSDRLFCRVQPQLARQMEIVLSSKSFPYKSRGDLVRHALMRHLAMLSELEPFPCMLSQIEAINDILREEEFHAEFEDIYRRLSSQVSKLLEDPSCTPQAKSLVSRIRAKIIAMPNSEWKTKYIRTLDSMFGHLLEGKPLSIADSVEEEEG